MNSILIRDPALKPLHLGAFLLFLSLSANASDVNCLQIQENRAPCKQMMADETALMSAEANLGSLNASSKLQIDETQAALQKLRGKTNLTSNKVNELKTKTSNMRAGLDHLNTQVGMLKSTTASGKFCEIIRVNHEANRSLDDFRQKYGPYGVTQKDLEYQPEQFVSEEDLRTKQYPVVHNGQDILSKLEAAETATRSAADSLSASIEQCQASIDERRPCESSFDGAPAGAQQKLQQAQYSLMSATMVKGEITSTQNQGIQNLSDGKNQRDLLTQTTQKAGALKQDADASVTAASETVSGLGSFVKSSTVGECKFSKSQETSVAPKPEAIDSYDAPSNQPYVSTIDSDRPVISEGVRISGGREMPTSMPDNVFREMTIPVGKARTVAPGKVAFIPDPRDPWDGWNPATREPYSGPPWEEGSAPLPSPGVAPLAVAPAVAPGVKPAVRPVVSGPPTAPAPGGGPGGRPADSPTGDNTQPTNQAKQNGQQPSLLDSFASMFKKDSPPQEPQVAPPIPESVSKENPERVKPSERYQGDSESTISENSNGYTGSGKKGRLADLFERARDLFIGSNKHSTAVEGESGGPGFKTGDGNSAKAKPKPKGKALADKPEVNSGYASKNAVAANAAKAAGKQQAGTNQKVALADQPIQGASDEKVDWRKFLPRFENGQRVVGVRGPANHPEIAAAHTNAFRNINRVSERYGYFLYQAPQSQRTSAANRW